MIFPSLSRTRFTASLMAGCVLALLPCVFPSAASAQTSGGLDTTFATGAGANATVRAVAVQSDGKTIVGGDFTSFNGVACGHLVRLDTTGSVDTTFAVGAGANNSVYAIAFQSDGKIVITGFFNAFDGVAQYRIARLNPDGSLDTTFLTGGGANNGVNCLAVQSDDKIVLGSSFFSEFDHKPALGAARLNADGSLDTTFHATVDNIGVFSVGVQSDGKVIVGGAGLLSTTDGFGNSYSCAMVRLNTDGSVDTTFPREFDVDTQIDASAITALVVQDDDRIICTGAYTDVEPGYGNRMFPIFRRVTANGGDDSSFAASLGELADEDSAKGTALKLQADGSVIAASHFNVGGVETSRVARFGSDGTLDATFDEAVSDGAGTINTLALQSPDKVILGGNFLDINGTAVGRVARLNGVSGVVQFSAPTYGVDENAGGVTVTVSRGSGSSGVATVNYSTMDGTAISVTDYAATSGTLTWIEGDTADKTFTVPILNPGFYDGGTRTFAVNLSDAGGAILGTVTTASVNISDNDTPPPTVTVLVVGDGMAVEGGERGRVFFERTGDLTAPLTVFYKAKGSAKAGTDYKPLAGSVTIPAGSARAKVKIKPIDDATHEDGTRKLKVRLLPPSDGSYLLGDPAVAKIKVIDND